jgi:hypothetical protein
MTKFMLALPVVAVALLASGCSSEFLGGGAAGVVGTGAGYEARAHQQMQKIDEDLKAGRIDQREYEIRKDQISRFSILK